MKSTDRDSDTYSQLDAFDSVVTYVAAPHGFVIVDGNIYVPVNLVPECPGSGGPLRGDRLRGRMVPHVQGRNRWRAVEIKEFTPR